MNHYFDVCGNEKPTFGFAPDAEFPCINAEKGMLDGHFGGEFTTEGEGDVTVKYMNVVGPINIVPAACEVIVESTDEAFIAAAKELHNATVEGNVVKFVVEGKPFHAMSPEKGINA